MRIQIHASKIDVDHTVETHVERRLGFALGRFADVVRDVEVTLSDINGPKGGHDKLCRIRVRLRGQQKSVFANILHEEIRTAIDLATDRIGRAVPRAVDRQNGLRVARRRRASLMSRDEELLADLV